MSSKEMVGISETLLKAGTNGLLHKASTGVRRRFGGVDMKLMFGQEVSFQTWAYLETAIAFVTYHGAACWSRDAMLARFSLHQVQTL